MHCDELLAIELPGACGGHGWWLGGCGQSPGPGRLLAEEPERKAGRPSREGGTLSPGHQVPWHQVPWAPGHVQAPIEAAAEPSGGDERHCVPLPPAPIRSLQTPSSVWFPAPPQEGSPMGAGQRAPLWAPSSRAAHGLGLDNGQRGRAVLFAESRWGPNLPCGMDAGSVR